MDDITWPAEALRRTLLRDFPGCKTANEAVKKVMLNRTKDQSPAGTPVKALTDVEAVLWAIIEISDRAQAFDIDLMNQDLRKKLAEMPLTNRAELKAWTLAWFDVMENKCLPLK